jgi:hypothetical protein
VYEEVVLEAFEGVGSVLGDGQRKAEVKALKIGRDAESALTQSASFEHRAG